MAFDKPGIRIHHKGEIIKPAIKLKIGDVAYPNLIYRFYFQPFYQIRETLNPIAVGSPPVVFGLFDFKPMGYAQGLKPVPAKMARHYFMVHAPQRHGGMVPSDLMHH